MRIVIKPTTDQQQPITRVWHATPGQKANIKLQVLGPATVFMSANRPDLESLDGVGQPQKGLQLNQGIFDFLGFSGEMFLACPQLTEVEVIGWML